MSKYILKNKDNNVLEFKVETIKDYKWKNYNLYENEFDEALKEVNAKLNEAIKEQSLRASKPKPNYEKQENTKQNNENQILTQANEITQIKFIKSYKRT